MEIPHQYEQHFIEKAKAILGEGYSFENTGYRGKDKEVVITCNKHGKFKTRPIYVYRSKTGCNKCAREKAKERFIKKAEDIHKGKYLYHKVKFKNMTVPVELVCPKHGSFFMEPYSHVKPTKPIGCMGCFQDRNGLTTEEFIRRSRKLHGDRYDYTKVSYKKERDHVCIGCSKHGDFMQMPRVHLMGCGCPRCFTDRKRQSTEEFVKEAIKFHGNRYNYDRVDYKGNKVKVEIVCEKHGSFMVRPNNHLSNKSGCPRCKESKGETRIRLFLEKHGIKYVQEYKIKPYKYRFDFYIPDYGMLIEFHGGQHYKPVELFGGEESFKTSLARDRKKKELAKEKGLYLVVLNYQMMKDKRIERFMELCLRFKGHVFNESLTITEKSGPCIV